MSALIRVWHAASVGLACAAMLAYLQAAAKAADLGGVPSPAPSSSAPPASTAAGAKSRQHHIAVDSGEVEPGHARVKLREDTWVYSFPAKSSKHIAQVHAGKFINVTGSTHYYLRVNLKDGKTGYVNPSSVELVRPMNKVFMLTSDSPVYDRPNRWGRKVSEVHKGHDVHVIGIALEYVKIRKKDGLEGYIPAVAME